MATARATAKMYSEPFLRNYLEIPKLSWVIKCCVQPPLCTPMTAYYKFFILKAPCLIFFLSTVISNLHLKFSAAAVYINRGLRKTLFGFTCFKISFILIYQNMKPKTIVVVERFSSCCRTHEFKCALCKDS